MKKTWIQIDGVLYPKGQEPTAEPLTPFIMPDVPGYQSPVTGMWVEGRKARREDLLRAGCREWEGFQTEKQEAARQREYQERANEQALDKAAWTTWYQMDPDKRRKLIYR